MAPLLALLCLKCIFLLVWFYFLYAALRQKEEFEGERRICGRIGGEGFETRVKEKGKGLQIQTKSRLREVELSVVLFTAGEAVCNMLCLLAESLAQSLLITVT